MTVSARRGPCSKVAFGSRQIRRGAVSRQFGEINMKFALQQPTKEEFRRLLTSLFPDPGRFAKLGQCMNDQLNKRPFSAIHYNPRWFDRPNAICVAYGIQTKELAEELESAGIVHLKYTLKVGVNHNEVSTIPHKKIGVNRPSALYIVPVVNTIKSQAQFAEEHISAHTMGKDAEQTAATRKAKLEAKLVKKVLRSSGRDLDAGAEARVQVDESSTPEQTREKEGPPDGGRWTTSSTRSCARFLSAAARPTDDSSGPRAFVTFG